MAQDERTYGFSKQDAYALVSGGVSGGEFEIPDVGPMGSSSSGAGMAVIQGVTAAATYSTSITIGGLPYTSSILPTLTGGFKLVWSFDGSRVIITRSTEIVTLYNPLPIELPYDAVVQYKKNEYGYNMIDTWICGTGVGSSSTVTAPISDAISGGKSPAIDMGYSLGV